MKRGLMLLVFLGLAMTALTQEKPETKANCYAYRIDEKQNRVYFNDLQIYILIPPKEERNQLRKQGELGQVFIMENCDRPDLAANLNIYSKPQTSEKEEEPIAKVISGMPVFILEKQGEWYRVKGRVELWQGEGWIKMAGKTILVKY